MLDTFTYCPPEPLTLQFNPPVTAGSGELATLVLREPTVGQVHFAERQLSDRNGNRGPRMYHRALIARVGKVPEDVLQGVPMSQFQRAADYLQAFVRAGVDEAEDDGDDRTTFTINFDPPLTISGLDYPALTVNEPTLDHLMKSDGFLRDTTPERVRGFQVNLVALASGNNNAVIEQMPISAVNRAATFCMGFTRGGQAT